MTNNRLQGAIMTSLAPAIRMSVGSKLPAMRVMQPQPALDYIQTNWANLKKTGAQSLAKLWKEKPYSVQVIADGKLGNEPLVLLSKRIFENSIKLNHDLEAGYAGIKFNLERVTEQLELVLTIVQEKAKEGAIANPDSLIQAVRITSNATKTIASHFIMSDGKEVAISPLSEEERAPIPE